MTMLSGADPELGHLEELRTDPIALMRRVRKECGEIGRFMLGKRDVVLVASPDANEWFFRAPDEALDQAEAYPFMKPIFGEGVIFDAPPERRREMLHNQALRDKFMRGHASTISAEVDRMIEPWSDGGGEIDLLDWFAELTIYTSSACLIGPRFRNALDLRFAELYHDLERGTDAYAYLDPYADIESFRRRDAARVELVELVQGIMNDRASEPEPPHDERDLLDVLMSIKNEDGTERFTADNVTGMFISMMFAGHHTTSGTAAWTLIELLRHPEALSAVVEEVDALMAEGESVSYQALRDAPRLEAAIKEALRLHPPLIVLMRVAQQQQQVGDVEIAPGQMVAVSVSVSNRDPDAFEEADLYDPGRYLGERNDEVNNPWMWIPFGAGRHRCVGAAFALMQLKAIFLTLLKDWEFEAAQPLDSYRDDLSKMVIQLQQPCAVRFRRRGAPGGNEGEFGVGADSSSGPVGDVSERYRVVVDDVLCQGHGVCESEAPAVFAVDTSTHQVRIVNERPGETERSRVETAVRYCPTRALKIQSED